MHKIIIDSAWNGFFFPTQDSVDYYLLVLKEASTSFTLIKQNFRGTTASSSTLKQPAALKESTENDVGGFNRAFINIQHHIK